MITEIQNLVKQINQSKPVTSVGDVYLIVDKYFERFVWSIEKQEWDSMSITERNDFCKSIFETSI